MKFKLSDWVQAKTKNGEFVHGFIESLDPFQGMASVFVVNSDNADSVGSAVAVREHWLRKLPEASMEDIGELRSLIDIALSTHDEEWFNELYEKLIPIQKNQNKKTIKPAAHPSYTNRLGYPV
jgi:hypothetical protein